MKVHSMRKNLFPAAVRAIRFGLLFALIGAAVMACGGGGKNGAPTELQANPTSAWEVITAGDIAQCNLQVAGKSNAARRGNSARIWSVSEGVAGRI